MKTSVHFVLLAFIIGLIGCAGGGGHAVYYRSHGPSPRWGYRHHTTIVVPPGGGNYPEIPDEPIAVPLPEPPPDMPDMGFPDMDFGDFD